MTGEVHACPRCAAPFARATYLALHLGRVHSLDLTPDERARFEAAVAEEARELAHLRRHAKAALAVFPLVLFYGFIFLAVYVSGASMGFAFLPLPGVVAVTVLLYFVTYAKDAPAAEDETRTLKSGPHP